MRKTLFNLHLCAGLVAGAFLLIAAVTGILLAYRPELDPAMNPARFQVVPGGPRLELDRIVQLGKAAHPAAFDYVQVSPQSGAATLIRYRDREEIFFDPYRGTELLRRNKDTSFFYEMEKLHRYLFLGKKGQWITGPATLTLFVLLASGLYLWWPKNAKQRASAFRFDAKLKGRARNVNWHKVVGFYSATILALTAFTGGAEFLNWVARTYFSPPSTRATGRALASSHPIGSPGAMPYEQQWRSIQTAIGPFQIARVTWPERPLGPLQVEYVAAAAAHPNALSYLFLDGYTGRILRSSPYEKETAASRFYLWLLPIHLGQLGGWPVRLAMVLGCAGLAALALTGGWLYYRRKWNPVRRPAPAPVAVASSPGPAILEPR